MNAEYVANKMTVYEFSNLNNNKEIGSAVKKNIELTMSSAANTESASQIMQFLLLWDRNFKASTRNTVNVPIPFGLAINSQLTPELTFFSF